ncbi:MAG: tetratricopeptide repeat protein [Alphaproteobacteria bacterium]|nr:tetratricopeptide repeat protein [Alphaproteobacteria bacterium]
MHGDEDQAARRGDAERLFRAGLQEQRAGRHDAAVAAYLQALDRDPAFDAVFNNLGAALMRVGRPEVAVPYLRRAVAAAAGSPSLGINLARALRAAGRLDEALAAAGQVTQRLPGQAEAWLVQGQLQRDAGALAAAEASFERALAIEPAHAEATALKAETILLSGDLGRGWAAFEARLRLPGAQGLLRDAARLGRPQWSGSDPRGRAILLRAEPGFGHQVMLVRFALHLAARGASPIIEVPGELMKLFMSLRGRIGLWPEGAPPPEHDLWAAVGSLPGLLGIAPADLPGPIPYLFAPGDLSPVPMPGPGAREGLRVGLCWAGDPRHLRDRERSVPLERLVRVVEDAGVSAVSLQVGAAAGDVARLGLQGIVRQPGRALRDFADLALAMAGVDLVITADTAPAHLAGALGRPAWVALPFAPDWRWQVGRADSPWYPSLRLFRQERPGDWAAPLEAMADALARRRSAIGGL